VLFHSLWMNIRHHQVGPGENEGAWKISDPSKRLQARAILHDLGNTRILHVCEISHNANCDFVIYCLKLAVQKLGALMISGLFTVVVANSRNWFV